ncbi:restriction endonuclease, partial [Undibacterium sp. Dicai25W]|uniref:restriction endonuclease n=1 Tax=Undibacterium sp. Dicai25W TaxID=3413034 RepID=UPI003BF35FE7
MLLDFTEIPKAIAPSPDTEAFEKFAKQFFEDIFDGKIEKTAGRGADGGADIIVLVNGQRWLVSCKHYLSSSVTASNEEDPKGRIDAHGCAKFIAFYSSSPNNSLNDKLRGIRDNRSPFDFEIFNDKDIESALLSIQKAKGWILAARWFPKSYSKIFSQLVHQFYL